MGRAHLKRFVKGGKPYCGLRIQSTGSNPAQELMIQGVFKATPSGEGMRPILPNEPGQFIAGNTSVQLGQGQFFLVNVGHKALTFCYERFSETPAFGTGQNRVASYNPDSGRQEIATRKLKSSRMSKVGVILNQVSCPLRGRAEKVK